MGKKSTNRNEVDANALSFFNQFTFYLGVTKKKPTLTGICVCHLLVLNSIKAD